MLGIAIPAVTGPGSAAGAEGTPARRLREKQWHYTERLGIVRPIGLAYAGDSDLFLVLSGPGGGVGPSSGASAGLVDRFHQPVGGFALPAD
jgi:hypothetical protein